MIALLKKNYPDSKCSLHFKTPFQLLIATILSAQCTDERVNKVTPLLFENYPDPQKMALAEIDHLETLVRSTGFYKNKAKNIKNCAVSLVEKYNSEIPQEMDLLSALPGVGRKTANVVLGTAYGIPGMVVDTHVTRLNNRFGFVKGENAVIIERELQEIVTKKDWVKYSHLNIDHGRSICKARSPNCEDCFLSSLCPQVGV